MEALVQHGLGLGLIQQQGPHSGVTAHQGDDAVGAALAQAPCQKHDCGQSCILGGILSCDRAPVCKMARLESSLRFTQNRCWYRLCTYGRVRSDVAAVPVTTWEAAVPADSQQHPAAISQMFVQLCFTRIKNWTGDSAGIRASSAASLCNLTSKVGMKECCRHVKLGCTANCLSCPSQ